MFEATKKRQLFIRYGLYSILFVMGLFLLFRQSLIIIEGQYIQESESRTVIFADYATQRYADYQILVREFETLLGRHLLATGELLVVHLDDYTLEDWQRIALEQDIDSIAIADENGYVYQGTDPNFVGLQVDSNHPMYDFWLSDDRVLVEPIREGNDVEGLFKFVTIRTEDNQLLQLAKRIDTYDVYLETISLQSVIDDVSQYDDVLFARVINLDGVILYHSDRSLIGQQVTEEHIFRVIDEDDELTTEHYHHAEAVTSYCMVRPIYFEGDMIGVLNIGYDVNYVAPIAAQLQSLMIVLGVIGLAVMFGVMAYMGKTRKILYDRTLHHPVTGLFNRSALELFYNQQILTGAFEKNHHTFMMVKVLNLAKIQSTHGSEYTDQLLKQLQGRLLQCSHQEGIYHITLDTLIMILHTHDEQEMMECSRATIQRLEEDITLEPFNFMLHPRLGLYKILQTPPTLSELIRNLDATILHMVEEGRHKVMLYDDVAIKSLERRQFLEQRIQQLIHGDSSVLRVLFQPIYHLKTETLTGFEALSRLIGDDGEVISPLEFIPMIKQLDAMIPFGKAVLQQVCAFMKSLGHATLTVSLNASVDELETETYAETLIKTLQSHNIPTSRIHVEITETEFARKQAIINETLLKLKEAGIQVALDDFGTGYSGMAYLSLVYFSFIKVDRAFIQELDHNATQPLAKTILQLARQYRVDVIAEGVETARQRDRLKAMGCDYVQGYYYHKPLSPKDARSVVKQERPK